MRRNYVLCLLLVLATPKAFSQVVTQQNILQGTVPLDPDSVELNKVILDRIILDDNIYSDARKTELGDQVRLQMAFRYHQDATTFARIRFVTNPEENRSNNQTSQFELLFSRQFNRFTFQLDLEAETNDPESGGTTVGLDLDSDDTFVSYFLESGVNFTFYPFNFRSDVGDEFNTWDVNRITYIEGSPTEIDDTPDSDVQTVTKTIPGLEISFNAGGWQSYVGYGLATYIYPTDEDFDMVDSPSATSWERKETASYKFGTLFLNEDKTKINLQHVAHDETSENGSLLAAATSLNMFQRSGTMLFEVEVTQTTAGDRPYNLNGAGNWFDDTTPFRPVHSDVLGNDQDWFGKTDQAYSLKIGVQLNDTVVPYLSYKYQGEHFVFNDDTSAERLRTRDESESHGGLTRIGIGSYFYYDNLFFSPLVEWRRAENAVFSNSTDLRQDRFLSSFEKEDMLFTFRVVYTFDGSNLQQQWWF